MKKILFAVAMVAGLAACGTSGQANSGSQAQTVSVMAASSLTGTLTKLAAAYEAIHPNAKVVLSFGASSTLAQQITAGAPAQVFASASKKSMDAASSRVKTPVDFLSNFVVLALPSGKGIDPCFGVVPCSQSAVANFLNQGNVKWIQCAHEVPCGAAADKATKADGVTTKPVSLEPDVKSVVSKMVAGEADAAIIYHTDIVAHPTLREIKFNSTSEATTKYSIGEIDSGNKAAEDFIAFVRSAAAGKVFSAAGFTVLN